MAAVVRGEPLVGERRGLLVDAKVTVNARQIMS